MYLYETGLDINNLFAQEVANPSSEFVSSTVVSDNEDAEHVEDEEMS